jgi:glyoxylase-like metal-dependent hydrolase (beta-lactamase superfamily II)
MIQDVAAREIAPGVHVAPDERIDLVPNVGMIVGGEAALVVDTGMGAANGRRVLERTRELAGDRPLLLTLTHFHPEHGFGAQAFRGEATLLYNESQREELAEKFESFVDMFSGFGPAVAELLADVELVLPRITYGDGAMIDLGGKSVQLQTLGPAHTRGDQIVFLPEEGVLFAGDLVENRFFPILPDEDAHGSEWISVLKRLETMDPAFVVPGHGEVGDVSLIREAREYLETVRSLVQGLAGESRSLDEIKTTLDPEIRERYASWDNEIWIGFAIEKFHAELHA